MKTPTLKDVHSFGKAIRKARFRKDWTQAKLGKMCGVTADAIGKIERGDFSPKPPTLKRLEKALGVSVKRFLDLGPGGEVMEGLQELTDQVKLLIQRVGKEGSVNPVLPDASEFTGSKADIIKVISHLQDEVEKLKDGAANPNPAEDEIEPETETPDEIINKLLTEHEDLKNQGTFKDFDGFWTSETTEERNFKAQLYVDVCNICSDLDLDAFDQIKNGLFSDKTNRAEAIRDVIVDFCTDDITKDEAREKLEKYLKPANPGDEDTGWDD